MASGIARGRVRTTTKATESRNMVAILQIMGWQRDMQLWFILYFFGIGHPCYDQLTPGKTRYPLTSITWPYRGLKFTAHQGQVVFEVDRWRSAVFFSIGSRAQLVFFSVTQFKIDQSKKSKPFNRLSPESGNRKKVDIQRPSPRFRWQEFFLWKICGETFSPNL